MFIAHELSQSLSVIKPLSILPPPDTSLQLRRDVIFCQAATGALCTLAEQLLAALRSRFNNAGEYQEDGKETSRKWLEQISVIGVLLHFQSTLAPHVVRTGFHIGEIKKIKSLSMFALGSYWLSSYLRND